MRELAGDKELVVKEVAYEALEKTVSILKDGVWLIGIIAALLAFGGVKEVGNFFARVRPEIKVARAILEEQFKQERLNEGSIRALQLQLSNQTKTAASIYDVLNKSRLQVEAVQNQVNQAAKNLPAQAYAAKSQAQENSLVQDFPVLTQGKQTLELDNHVYQPPSVISAEAPLIYLELPLSAETRLSLKQLQVFLTALKAEKYSFTSGNFVLREGNVSFGGSVIPGFAQCSQIIYFEPRYLPAAEKVASLLSSSFATGTMIPRFVDLNVAPVFDPTSRAIVQQSGISVAASLSDPEPSYCKQILGH